MTNQRALGIARISNLTDESTSIERQDESITFTVKGRGDTLVSIAHDTDVSGSVSPFDREGLGPWLTDPAKICQWDYLIFTKVDRLTRSLRDFDDIVQWCDQNGKTLIGIQDSIDLSTYTGRMFANLLAMFAQFERERMGDRAKESHAKSQANGWWHGGHPPYGYEPVKVDSHYELVLNEDEATVVRSIVSSFLAGHSRNAIARALNERGIPSPYGRQWAMIAVKRVLEASASFVSTDDFNAVRDRLDDTSNPVTRRTDVTMLLNVAYCTCGSPLYSGKVNHPGRSNPTHEYYRCYAKCGARNMPMQALDDAVTDALIDGYGWVPVVIKSVTRGKNHAKEILAVEREIRHLDLDAPDYATRHGQLVAERARLKGLPVGDSYIDYTPTGKTVAEYWPTLTPAARREFLLANGTKIHARHDGTGRLYRDGDLSVVLGPDLETFEGAEFFTTVAGLSTIG